MADIDKSPKTKCEAIRIQNTKFHTDITSYAIGDFGKWQLGISFLMALLKFPLAWFQLGIVFLAPEQKFWCKKPDIFSNISQDNWIQFSQPNEKDEGCHIYDPHQLQIGLNKSQIDIVDCEEFVFDTTDFSSTITSEWNLVCSKKRLVEVTFMLGVLIGNVLFGFLADRYGRKKPLLACIVIQATAAFGSALLPTFAAFIVTRFTLAIASGGIAIISFVMCMEVVSGKWRTIIPILYQIPFGLGNSVMAAMAYKFRDWRQFELSLSLLSAIFVIYICLVPESPRWLLAVNKKDDARELLERIAIINGYDPTVIESVIECKYSEMIKTKSKTDDRSTLKIFFQSRNLRLKTILLCIQWFATGVGFFAFSQYLGKISNNIYVTVALGGIVTIPGALLCMVVVQSFGRKPAIATCQLLTAICFLLILTVPKNAYPGDWPRVLFSGIGLIGISISVPALYLYTGELFPTVVRNAGVGGVSMFSRLGSMMAPFIISLEGIAACLPLLVLGILTAFQSIILYPLPETKGCPLPETIEQADAFDKDAASNIKKGRINSSQHKIVLNM